MIDEQVLERALRAEAASYDVPPGGADAILAAANVTAAGEPGTGGTGGTGGPRGARPGRWRTVVVGSAAALVVGVLGVSVVAQRSPYGGLTAGAPSSDLAYRDGLTTGGAGGRGANEEKSGGLADTARVVRTADVSLEVPRARVADTVRELSRIATAHRGFVAGSSTATTREAPYGTATLRVPAGDLDAVLAEVGRLGTVVSSDVRGEDVTAEVTDVEARLTSLKAARAQLQALLGRAKDVTEVLAVQQRVTEVQTEIEQLQARQKSLADRTTFATVTVSVARTGGHEPEREGFAKAWRSAVDGFVGGFEWLVAASGTIAFALLAGGALLLLGRAAYRLFVRRVV